MRVIRNRIIPIGGRFGAINVFGILFVKRDMLLTKEVINHELIHTAQMRELGYVPFYLLYVMEWAVRLLCHRFDFYKSYHAITFEKEAYRHEDNLNYLKTRRHLAQWRM